MQWERTQPLSLTDLGLWPTCSVTWGSSLPVFLSPQPLEVLVSLRETKESDTVCAPCMPCPDRAGCLCPGGWWAGWSAREFLR